MKYLFIFILSLLFFSCNQNNELEPETKNPCTACGIENVQQNLPWLKDLIKKAEIDKTGNYLGWIWLEKYNGQDIFVTNMMLGSGGVAYWVFNCSGDHYYVGKSEHCPVDNYVGSHHFNNVELPPLNELKLNVVVYSNLPDGVNPSEYLKK